MTVLDEKWHAKEESGRIYDERGSCVADLCAPEAKRATHLRFFMGAQEIARAALQMKQCPDPRSAGGRMARERMDRALRAAGVLDDVSEPKGE